MRPELLLKLSYAVKSAGVSNVGISEYRVDQSEPHQVSPAPAQIILPRVHHHCPPSNVSLPAVPEGDAAVHQGDEGDGGALHCQDVAEVPRVSVEGPGPGVFLHVRVEVTPRRLAVVPGVARHVYMEPVLARAQSQDLALDEDPEGSLLQEE